ncbi:MAG TPA: flagellar hook capping FlgD N-terminal domain-containing protein [Novosphingobium sp.]|nr:flagellar hook capping FlgD N-terminal domain-containing protein [Novosphingobium sp.]HZV09731.1 flagellar hook capping FlgD N-terminal domain-containing protein [Novosphingobium sp.]
MTSVSSATSAASTAASTASTTSSNPYANLGMKDFLSLLTTELKDQDPTQPTDNTQMVAQMATFSQLSGIQTIASNTTGLGSTLSKLASAIGGTSTTTSA